MNYRRILAAGFALSAALPAAAHADENGISFWLPGQYGSFAATPAVPLPALMRIFDDVRYQNLDGRLLEGIARLFGSDVRVLAWPAPREELLHLLEAEPGPGWEVDGVGQWITADRLRPAPPLRHLYEYLLASGFLVAMPPD